MSFFRTRFHIVEDQVAGYEVQWKAWWNPFWFRRNNTHTSLERARDMVAKLKRGKVVEYL